MLKTENRSVCMAYCKLNLSKCNISGKKSFLNVGPKLFYFGIFGLKSKKLLCCGILQKPPQIFRNTKFWPNIKILKFGTEIAVIGYFRQEFQKTNVVFEIEFVKMQSVI